MSFYQQEQIDTLQMVLEYLQSLSEEDQRALADLTAEYLAFRKKVDAFLAAHLSDVCTLKCYKNRLSACCSKEGIITFFADVVINALVSSQKEIGLLTRVLGEANKGFKCIYLGPDGCLWHLKPIVCEMFICDRAKQEVFGASSRASALWDALKKKETSFRWPDRVVLFDELESRFMAAGVSSSLMYLHNSPGLIRIKKNAGLL
jgi:hypothetical protein